MEYLSLKATRNHLGVSRQAIYDMIKRGELKTLEVGGHPVISRKLVEKVKAQRETKGHTNGQSSSGR